VVLGRVSIAHAREAYGVVIVVAGDGLAVDGGATAALRARGGRRRKKEVSPQRR